MAGSIPKMKEKDDFSLHFARFALPLHPENKNKEQ